MIRPFSFPGHYEISFTFVPPPYMQDISLLRDRAFVNDLELFLEGYLAGGGGKIVIPHLADTHAQPLPVMTMALFAAHTSEAVPINLVLMNDTVSYHFSCQVMPPLVPVVLTRPFSPDDMVRYVVSRACKRICIDAFFALCKKKGIYVASHEHLTDDDRNRFCDGLPESWWLVPASVARSA